MFWEKTQKNTNLYVLYFKIYAKQKKMYGYVQTKSSLLNTIFQNTQFVIFWLAHKMLICFENYRLFVIGGNTKLNQVIEGPQNWNFPN
jgi:hypothetical protein